MYQSLHHVSLAVTDLVKAKQFYEEVLGFEESGERPNFTFPGAWYHIGSGANQLHLIVNREAKTLRGTLNPASWDGHFAVRVSDIQAVIERLKKHSWPYEYRASSMISWHQVFLTDPDGNVIEINAERLER